MQVVIVNQSGRPVPRQFIKRWMSEINRQFPQSLKRKIRSRNELIIAFVDLKNARRLNKKYRGKNYATDVLSFSSDEPGVLGELVICPKVISRQAGEHGLLVREELGYMILHGILHLLGFDHERSEADAKRMFQIQDQLFDRLLSRTSRPAKRMVRRFVK